MACHRFNRELLSSVLASLALVLFAAGGVMLLPATALAQSGDYPPSLCPSICGGSCAGTPKPCEQDTNCGPSYCSHCICFPPDVWAQTCACR